MEMEVDIGFFFFLQPTGSDMAILFFYAANLTRLFFFSSTEQTRHGALEGCSFL